MALEIFTYNRIRFDQMYADAKNYLQNRFNQVGDVFSPASAYGQLLGVILDLGKLNMQVHGFLTRTASASVIYRGYSRTRWIMITRASSATRARSG